MIQKKKRERELWGEKKLWKIAIIVGVFVDSLRIQRISYEDPREFFLYFRCFSDFFCIFCFLLFWFFCFSDFFVFSVFCFSLLPFNFYFEVTITWGLSQLNYYFCHFLNKSLVFSFCFQILWGGVFLDNIEEKHASEAKFLQYWKFKLNVQKKFVRQKICSTKKFQAQKLFVLVSFFSCCK